MKKLVSWLIAAAMLTATLAGCSSGEPDVQEPAQNPELTLQQKLEVDPDAKLTITVMSMHHTQQRRALMDETIAQFNKTYPNVTIEHNPVEDYIQAMKLAFDSGEAPDIVYVDDTTQNMLERNNYLYDMTDIVSEMNWAEHVKPGTLEYQNKRHPGQISSVPYISGPRVVWYNKAIFDELGLEVPVTIDAFNDCLKKVKDAGYIPFEASVRSLLWHIDGLVFGTVPMEDITKWYYLEETTDAYRDGKLAAMRQVEEWIQNGYFREDVTSIDHNNLNLLFGRGETAFYVGSASAAAPLNEANLDVGAFPFPKKSAEFQSTLVDASDSAWAINAAIPDEKLGAAVAFINQFFTQENAKTWSEGGFISLTNFDLSDADITPQQHAAQDATEGCQMGYFLDNAAPGLLNSLEILNSRLLLKEIDGDQYAQLLEDEYEKLKAEELSKR